MKKMKKFLQFVLIIFFVFVVICLLSAIGPVGCIDKYGATKILTSNGYTNISITGWKPWLCDENDNFATGFEATSVTGSTVKGCVCSGILKGYTIRFE